MPEYIATDYGSDLSTYADPASGVADLDPTWTVISGPRVVVERIARKLQTPAGSMLKAGWGIDLREALQSSLLPAQVAQMRGVIADQINQEPEVDDCDVEINDDFLASRRTLMVTGRLYLKTGEIFPLVLEINPTNIQPIFDDIENPGIE